MLPLAPLKPKGKKNEEKTSTKSIPRLDLRIEEGSTYGSRSKVQTQKSGSDLDIPQSKDSRSSPTVPSTTKKKTTTK